MLLDDHDRFAGEAMADPEVRRAYADANYERGRGEMLAEVLAALRDRSGLADWLEGKGRFVWPDGPTLDIAGTYLADRFGAKGGTDG